jgi:hypothetical protein
VYRSSSSISVPAITLVSGRNVFTDITGARYIYFFGCRKILHPIFPFLNPFLLLFLSHTALSSVSLSVSVFLVLDCSRNSVQTAKNSTQIRRKITQLSQQQTSAQAGSSSSKKVNCGG